MNQPQRSAYPDYIVLRTAANILDISDIDGEWLDRQQKPFLEAAVALHGMRITPSSELVMREDGTVAQIWDLTLAEDSVV